MKKMPKTGGAPYIYKQYTSRAQPGSKKERIDLEREKKASHNKEHPKNSEKRDYPTPKTAETTLTVIG